MNSTLQASWRKARARYEATIGTYPTFIDNPAWREFVGKVERATQPDGRDSGCYLFMDTATASGSDTNRDSIDRRSAAYLSGVDDGYGCARGLHVPPAEIVAAWGQAYAEREGYHPAVRDTVRLWYTAGFAQGCQEWLEASK